MFGRIPPKRGHNFLAKKGDTEPKKKVSGGDEANYVLSEGETSHNFGRPRPLKTSQKLWVPAGACDQSWVMMPVFLIGFSVSFLWCFFLIGFGGGLGGWVVWAVFRLDSRSVAAKVGSRSAAVLSKPLSVTLRGSRGPDWRNASRRSSRAPPAAPLTGGGQSNGGSLTIRGNF